jgi:hypothetical protein
MDRGVTLEITGAAQVVEKQAVRTIIENAVFIKFNVCDRVGQHFIGKGLFSLEGINR